MSDTLNGLLSGKYDSTKQRAVLLNGDRLRNYQSYTATMRMELLLTGHLIFTDAQFFDGLYFHWLAANKTEFDAFKQLMVSYQESKEGQMPLFSIAVKCRGNTDAPDLDQVAYKTFCKQFQFSSIEHNDLARAVFDLSNDYSELCLTEYDEKNWSILEQALKLGCVTDTLQKALGEKYKEYMDKFSQRKFELAGTMKSIKDPPKNEQNLQSYIQFMEQQLQDYKGPESSIAKNWTRYVQKLETLFDIGDCANKWGALRGSKGWCADYRLAEYLDQPCPVDPDHSTYRKKMEELLKQAENGMASNSIAKRYFARIRDELNRNISNRSKITTSLDELERLNNPTHVKEISEPEQVKACFREFRQLMNERYNKALADQHGCQFLDLCDYSEALSHISKTTEILHNITIPRELVNSLVGLSWENFVKQMQGHQTDLKQPFNEWMTAYEEFPKCKIERVKTCLEKYLAQLASKITDTASKECSVLEFTGPWDEAGTCNNDIRTILSEAYRCPCYFIGGGSFEASSEGNEICILCTGQDTSKQEDRAVLRLRFDEEADDDRSFDTLLAPVCNPLNGGAL